MQKKINKRSEIIGEELKKVSNIETFQKSEGGKLLFKSLMADAVSCIDTISMRYATLTHIEMIALCADIKTKLDLARVMRKSIKNTTQAKLDLEEALLEESNDE